MKKIVIAIIIVGAILSIALYAEKTTAPVQDVSVRTPEVIQHNAVASLKKPPYREDAPLRFECNSEKIFNLEIVSVQNSPGPGDTIAAPKEVSLARITFDNSPEEISLRQDSANPELYELSGNSLSLKDDNATLTLENEVFVNCSLSTRT